MMPDGLIFTGNLAEGVICKKYSLLELFSNKTNKYDSVGKRKGNLVIAALTAVLFR